LSRILDIAHLLDEIAERPGWRVLAVEDAAWEARPALPGDLEELRRRCGGVRTPAGLVVGQHVRGAQAAILGEVHPHDRSYYWYVIAEMDDSSHERARRNRPAPGPAGPFYEAFWRFDIAGSMPVVAASVTELLERLLDANADVYWSDGLPASADAYD
jgi:hypothetical protein